jgi:flagellar motor protein MotB
MSRYAKKKYLGEKGVDDWLMTYADMITLLICFFAVFLSVSVPKEEAFEQAQSLNRPDIAESLKKELEGEIKGGKLTMGQDNLYRGHVDKLECLCGNLSAFIKHDMEDKKEGEVEEINRGEAY